MPHEQPDRCAPMTPKQVKGLSPLHVRPTCFVDMEFVGFASHQPIVDVAVIKDRTNGETEYYESKIAISGFELLNADRKALEIIGFDEEEWKGAPERQEVLTYVWNMTAGCAWVGHNLDGDLKHLEAQPGVTVGWREVCRQAIGNLTGGDVERLRHHMDALEIPLIKRPWCPLIDTAHLARIVLPGLDGYKLSDLCAHYGIEQEGDHRAMGGAQRCREIFYSLLGRKGGVLTTPTESR